MIQANKLDIRRKKRSKTANSTTPESAELARITRWAAERDDVYLCRVVQAGAAGVPDLLLCVRGIFVGVEVKAPNKPLREIQHHHGGLITQADGIFLWGTSDVVLPELDKIYNTLTES